MFQRGRSSSQMSLFPFGFSLLSVFPYIPFIKLHLVSARPAVNYIWYPKHFVGILRCSDTIFDAHNLPQFLQSIASRDVKFLDNIFVRLPIPRHVEYYKCTDFSWILRIRIDGLVKVITKSRNVI